MSATTESLPRALPDANVLRTEIERAIQRNIKGLDFLSSVPPAVGMTPKDEILRRGTLSLYHYHPLVSEVYRVPLLMVMATTNRAYIFDLAPGQSMVEYLLKQGYDVYVMDWNPPRADEKHLRIEDYVLDFIPDCIRHVQQTSGEQDLTVLGYCQGGVLTTMYAALHPDGPAKNYVFFTTPIDFSQMKLFHNWSDKRYFDVDRLVDTLGNAPPEMLLASFDLLRPASRTASMVQLLDKLDNDEFVKSYRMFDRWSNEILPLAGEYFRQTVKELMWENRLYKNELMVGGRRVELKNITKPVLHVLAQHDHIVPYDAAKPLIANIGSKDKEEVVLKGGHVSLAAGLNAVKRLWPKLDQWLSERSL